MNAAKIIFHILSEDTDVTTALGASAVNGSMVKIYRHVAPQKETAPFITFSQIPSSGDQTAPGLKVRTVKYMVNCWAATPDAADTIAELAITALDNVSGTVDGLKFDNILYLNDDEAFVPNLDPPLYGRQIEFQIRIAL